MRIFVSHQLNNNTLSWESRFLERISNYTNTHYFFTRRLLEGPPGWGAYISGWAQNPMGVKAPASTPRPGPGRACAGEANSEITWALSQPSAWDLGVPESGGMRFCLLRNSPPPPFLGDQFLETDCKVRAGSIPLRLLRPKTWGWDGSLCQIYYLGSETNKQNNSYLKCIASLAIEVSLSNSSF